MQAYTQLRFSLGSTPPPSAEQNESAGCQLPRSTEGWCTERGIAATACASTATRSGSGQDERTRNRTRPDQALGKVTNRAPTPIPNSHAKQRGCEGTRGIQLCG